jgi:hypothetical protein
MKRKNIRPRCCGCHYVFKKSDDTFLIDGKPACDFCFKRREQNLLNSEIPFCKSEDGREISIISLNT